MCSGQSGDWGRTKGGSRQKAKWDGCVHSTRERKAPLHIRRRPGGEEVSALMTSLATEVGPCPLPSNPVMCGVHLSLGTVGGFGDSFLL